MIKRTLLCILLPFFMAFALGDPKHSTVDISHKKTGKGQLVVTFKVIPKPGMVANMEKTTPWQLVLKEVSGLKTANGDVTWDANKLDKSLPGYRITLEPLAPNVKAKYELKAFVCTADKKRCYPEIHRGEINF